LKPAGIYRKLAAMAPVLLGLAAALAVADAVFAGPRLPLADVEPLVNRLVASEARALAADRGIRLSRPLEVRLLDRVHFAAERAALADSRAAPAEARAEASLRWRLGLGGDPRVTAAPPSAHFEATGLYDPAAKRVLIGNWSPLELERFGRWRDLAEGLLDRRFTFERLLRTDAPVSPEGRHSDATLARLALIEGDATVQALERLSPDGLPPTRLLAEIVAQSRQVIAGESSPGEPLELARRLFLQLDGTAFVAGVRAREPWSVVDQVWERPPESTEQILHPEKYWRHESPDDLSARLPAGLAGGAWQAAFRDTLGELGVRVFLERVVGEHRAARAAAGWSGDRVALYRDASAGEAASDRELVVWLTTWDDVTDAGDFAEQAAAVVGALAGAALEERPPPAVGRGPHARRDRARRWRQTDARGRVFLLEQRGSTVGMVLGAPPDLERAWPAIMAGVGRAPPRPRRPPS